MTGYFNFKIRLKSNKYHIADFNCIERFLKVLGVEKRTQRDIEKK